MPIFLAMMLFALLALSAAPAFALKEYVPGITFGEPCGPGETPCGPGKLKEPSGVAVNDSSEPLTEPAAGDVYVVDTGDNRVERFTSTGVFQGQFDGGSEFEVEPGVKKATPAPPQPLAAPEYVAVDNSTTGLDSALGDVYVTDNGHHAIDRFSPAGEYLGQLTGTCPSENESQAAGECVPSGVAVTPFAELLGIAVGATGEVWVHDNTGSFDEFTNTGVYTTTFNKPASNQPGGIALDSEGNIYANSHEVREGRKYSPSGEVEGEFVKGGGVSGLAVVSLTADVLVDTVSGLELYAPLVESEPYPAPIQATTGGLAESHGVAVNSASVTQTAYASERVADDVRAFNYVSFPTVTAPSAVEVSNTVETLGGTVEPEGEPVTECRFEYGLVEAEPGHYEHSVACEQKPEDITGTSMPVSAKVEGLTPGATYHYRLDVSNGNGTGSSKDATFTLFPALGGGSFSGVGSSSAVVHATVEPGGVPTSYFFEYGTSTEYGSHTTVESAGASSDAVAVSAPLEGLSPDTTYHFRVVASSTDGTVRGADASFSTFPLAISGLPDGRGYELVSPLENGYAEVVSGTRAAADGSAVAYLGQAPEQGGNGNNGGPNETGVSAGGSNEYLASRSSTGWTATDIQPPGLASVGYQAFSAELSTALLASSEPLVPGAPAERALYSRRSATGSFALLGAGASYSASTPDGQHVLYSTGVAGLFETGVGAPAAVNVLPKGGSAAHAVFGAPTRNVVSPTSIVGPFGPDLSNAVSADGSRVFWTETDAEGDPLRLFVTEHAGSPAARTVPLDASQFEGHAGGEGRFVTASADGSRVFFTDCNQLTANSTAVPVSRCEEVVERSGEFVSTPKGDDLYEYDLSTGTLTDLTVAAGEEHAQVVGVLGSSADGSYVYFAAGGVLAGGASPQKCLQPSPAELGQGIETKCNIYMVHDGGAPVFVAVLSSHDWADWGTVLGQHAAYVAPGSGDLVFTSVLDLAAFRAHAQHEIYMFTTATGVSCLSCNPSGALTPPGSGASLPGSGSTTFALRDVSADGSWVFFETAEGLVPQDRNGKTDVYEWERDGSGSCTRAAGCLYLISGATSAHNSHFVDASENGNDVFFISDAELVPADRGEYVQLWDARVGASEPLAQTACTGTGCQGVPPAPPIFATPPSATITGVDDLAPPPAAGAKKATKKKTVKCAKGKKLARGKCVKARKKAKAKKSAHINRRAPR
jgi:hypothetical protein